jgi:putative transposase
VLSAQAELPDLTAAFPEYAASHGHVLQDALTRLDTTCQAFCRRLKAGENVGFPRAQGCNRYHSFTVKQFGNGARLDNVDNGLLVLAQAGRVAVRWSRPLESTPKTVTMAREADGWHAILSSAEVPAQPLPATGTATGTATGIAMGLKGVPHDGGWAGH